MPVPLAPPCNELAALGALETACGDAAVDVPADKSVVVAADEGALEIPLLAPLVGEAVFCARKSWDVAARESSVNMVKIGRVIFRSPLLSDSHRGYRQDLGPRNFSLYGSAEEFKEYADTFLAGQQTGDERLKSL